ncbi:hypothetical protein CMO90_03380 [Candidatus Woesearchaeota archaeon]|jgi:uncharacterized membrane protein HdeD (DUF308 family)|nr:hypothetical protein [Candidatus Woesearchaeota archaeon]
MTKIPGFVYFILGIIISAYSKYIEEKTKADFLTIFFYIGIFFIFIGIVKMIFAPSKTKKNFKHKKNYGHIMLCPRCKTKNYNYSRFCHICSYRLK